MDGESGCGLEEAQANRLGTPDNFSRGIKPVQDFKRCGRE